jgi:hypothetical protein
VGVAFTFSAVARIEKVDKPPLLPLLLLSKHLTAKNTWQ